MYYIDIICQIKQVKNSVNRTIQDVYVMSCWWLVGLLISLIRVGYCTLHSEM